MPTLMAVYDLNLLYLRFKAYNFHLGFCPHSWRTCGLCSLSLRAEPRGASPHLCGQKAILRGVVIHALIKHEVVLSPCTACFRVSAQINSLSLSLQQCVDLKALVGRIAYLKNSPLGAPRIQT